jgi:hypothetical protein
LVNKMYVIRQGTQTQNGLGATLDQRKSWRAA